MYDLSVMTDFEVVLKLLVNFDDNLSFLHKCNFTVRVLRNDLECVDGDVKPYSFTH